MKIIGLHNWKYDPVSKTHEKGRLIISNQVCWIRGPKMSVIVSVFDPEKRSFVDWMDDINRYETMVSSERTVLC